MERKTGKKDVFLVTQAITANRENNSNVLRELIRNSEDPNVTYVLWGFTVPKVQSSLKNAIWALIQVRVVLESVLIAQWATTATALCLSCAHLATTTKRPARQHARCATKVATAHTLQPYQSHVQLAPTIQIQV
jgi:hypothetical protein